MTRLVECVPNFSEGRDPAVIQQITDAIEAVDGVKLLDVDPGKAREAALLIAAEGGTCRALPGPRARASRKSAVWTVTPLCCMRSRSR